MSSTVERADGEGKEKYIAAALIGVHGFVLLYLALFRYIDGDEGFYLSAASQVAAGRTLYTDFFFPQMPFLPWIQSLVAGHGFQSLYYTRLLGLLPATLTPVLLYAVLRDICKRGSVRLFLLFSYCFSGLFLVWHSVAKTYAWTDLWLIVLFLCLIKGIRTDRIWFWLAAGVSFALAVNFRSVLVVTIVPVAYAWESSESGRKWSSAAAFLLGALAISAPSIGLLIGDPARFYFNNLGYHFIRNPGVSFAGGLLERARVLGNLLLIPQIWVVVGGLIVTWRIHRRLSENEVLSVPVVLAWLFAGMIALVYVLPSPVHLQYFEQALTFALLGAVPGFVFLTNPTRPKLLGMKRRLALTILIGGYLLTLIPFVAVFLGAIRKDNQSYTIRNMTELCEYVRNYPATGPLFSEWPGVTALSGREGVAGLEFVGFQYQFPLSNDQLKEFRLPVSGDLSRLLSEQVPAVYVVWNAPDTSLAEVAWKNYHVDREFGQFRVLVRNERTK
jgi:hypothetical protein